MRNQLPQGNNPTVLGRWQAVSDSWLAVSGQAYLVGRSPEWHIMPRFLRFSVTCALHSSSNLQAMIQCTCTGNRILD